MHTLTIGKGKRPNLLSWDLPLYVEAQCLFTHMLKRATLTLTPTPYVELEPKRQPNPAHSSYVFYPSSEYKGSGRGMTRHAYMGRLGVAIRFREKGRWDEHDRGLVAIYRDFEQFIRQTFFGGFYPEVVGVAIAGLKRDLPEIPDCPIEVTDETSMWVAADWWEEYVCEEKANVLRGLHFQW